MKSGIKTSEFWLSLLGVVGIALGPEKGAYTDSLIAGVISVYTAGRSLMKSFKGQS